MSDSETYGDIRAIVFSEFHPTAGPKIAFQIPEDYLSREQFDRYLHVFIITKPELQNKLITINVLGYKILGCPVVIEGHQYKRNALIFNLCFVFDCTIKNSECYEGVVKKLAGYLRTYEIEKGFLSKEESKTNLPIILKKILVELNTAGCCSIELDDSNFIHLKVVTGGCEPAIVSDQDVPVFISGDQAQMRASCCSTLEQVLSHVNGYNHVAKIAAETDVELDLVKACMQNLLYFKKIKLIPIFQYSNVYTTTARIKELVHNKLLQSNCLQYVAKHARSLPHFRDVFSMYCALTPGTTVRDLCTRYNPSTLKVNERRLIQFGLIHDFIRKLHPYPVKLQTESLSPPKTFKLASWFNGLHSCDEICSKNEMSHQELSDRIESDPSIVLCWK